jgi:hypothetical protein
MESLDKQATFLIHGFSPVKEFNNLRAKPEPKFSAIEKSRKRAKQNLQTGEILGKIAEAQRDVSAAVTADLLKISGCDKANGELANLLDKRGRVFNCPQALISANTRLDTNYQIKTARRHRKRIYEAFTTRLDEIKEHSLSVSFLTPTFPNLLGVGFAGNDQFQARAWELFLQMKIFGEFFYAGFSKTEWTLGGAGERAKTGRAFDLHKDGINYHSHVLCINHKPLAEGETFQLESKLESMKGKKYYTADDKRLIRDSLKLVSAWTECLKKAHREIFGKTLKVGTKSGRVKFTFQNVAVTEVQAFDVEESKNGIFWEIAKTANYTAKGNNYNSLAPELLLEAENVFRGKRLINPFGVFRKQVQKLSSTSRPLVKPPTKQSEIPANLIDNSLFNNALRGETESLKNYGIRLCSQGLRYQWLRYLEADKDLIISKRRDALLGRFPNAVFTDLSGQKYYGWKARRLFNQEEKEKQEGYNPESNNHHVFRKYIEGLDEQEFKVAEEEFLDELEGNGFSLHETVSRGSSVAVEVPKIGLDSLAGTP